MLVPGDRRLRLRVDRIGLPAFRLAAAEVPVAVFGAEWIAGRMARATVAEALGKIAAAVPGIALAGIRLPLAAVEEKQLPAGKQRPETSGKRKVVSGASAFTATRVMRKA